MIKFTKPQELNGSQLRKELRNGQVPISDNALSVRIDDNDELWLEIDDKHEAAAAAIVESHVGIDESAMRAAEKAAVLAKLGLTEDEAKAIFR